MGPNLLFLYVMLGLAGRILYTFSQSLLQTSNEIRCPTVGDVEVTIVIY